VPDDKVKEEEFMQHVKAVLKNWKPFSIRIGGFEKSWDHWLLLLLKEGNEKVIALHDELYTEILAPYLRKDIKFIPHIGIGLFVRKDSGYRLLDPKKVAYDTELYAGALKEAEALEIDTFDTIDKLVVNKVILEGTSLYLDRTVLGSKEIKL
jgi:2'-5' RNA ligase